MEQTSIRELRRTISTSTAVLSDHYIALVSALNKMEDCLSRRDWQSWARLLDVSTKVFDSSSRISKHVREIYDLVPVEQRHEVFG